MLVEGKALAPRVPRVPLVAVVNADDAVKVARLKPQGRPLAAQEPPQPAAAAQSMQQLWSLKAFNGTTNFILAKSPLWIGRWKERAGLWLDDGGRPSKASRLHARLEKDEASGAWTLTDNDSANGTFVNGRRIKSAVLQPADRVGFGSSAGRPETGASSGSSGGASSGTDASSVDLLHPSTMPLFHFTVVEADVDDARPVLAAANGAAPHATKEGSAPRKVRGGAAAAVEARPEPQKAARRAGKAVAAERPPSREQPAVRERASSRERARSRERKPA
eukprot:728173-Prymnesium_polylepis.1